MEPVNKKRKLTLPNIKSIPFMLCEICKIPVYNYGECQTWIYCGYDCYSVLMLNYTIDNEYKSFNEYFLKNELKK